MQQTLLISVRYYLHTYRVVKRLKLRAAASSHIPYLYVLLADPARFASFLISHDYEPLCQLPGKVTLLNPLPLLCATKMGTSCVLRQTKNAECYRMMTSKTIGQTALTTTRQHKETDHLTWEAQRYAKYIKRGS